MGFFQKYAPPTCKQLKNALTKAGFCKENQVGSHEKWAKTDSKGKRWVVTVDCPKSPFSNTLLVSMANQAGLSKKELLKLCHEKNYEYTEDSSLNAADE